MKFSAKIQPSGVNFPVSDEVTILESAMDSNLHLGHSCLNGNCGSCKSKLIKGEAKNGSVVVTDGLSEAEIQEGYILTCQAIPISDVELEADYYPELAEIKKSLTPCKIDLLEFLSKDTLFLKLKLPPNSKFKYLAGQYLQLIVKGERRSYSIANIPETYSGIELHIRKVENGLFSEYFFNEAKSGELLRLEGPYGSFFVRQGKAPIIFLAGGTGFAPVKAMVEQLLQEASDREIYIYWGASTASGFYSKLPEVWEQQGNIAKYIPVMSGNEKWSGRKGFVHESVLDDFKSLEQFHVYACGSPEMIRLAQMDFAGKGLLSENFHSDAFVSS